MPLLDISWRIENLDEVIAKLAHIPGAATFAVGHAILDTLTAVRTRAARAARERYNIPYNWVKNSMGTPRVIGMYGLLRSTGARAPLFLFPHSDVYPGGRGFPPATVTEVKGHTMKLAHAFHTGVKTRGPYHGASAGESRYPIHAMVGLAAPQMIDEKSQVWPNIETFERAKLQERLAHYIGAILGGAISV